MDKKKISGVYSITHIASSRQYIGCSVNIIRRWRRHKSELKTNKHFNKKLQNAWNKYGKSAFIFEILEECLPEKKICEEREQFYLDIIKPYYNASLIAAFPRHTNKKRDDLSDETREMLRLKMSEYNKRHYKGKAKPEDQKKKLSESNKGKHVISESTRQKMITSHLGKTRTLESRLKQSRTIKERSTSSSRINQEPLI